ncbi:MAG TPA: Hsp20/alpha crystallin family protein [Gemmataceae bacterium]|jgi:HSP20 family protein|nr:Hsp20/alpha crystallin family protein [Gemmataceae bacterium]
MPSDLIRLMHSLFLPAAETFRGAIWQPPVDVYRTRKGWLVKFELAGVRPEDIHLSVNGRRLTVQGTRRDWFVEEECSCYRMEIAYSHFERTIEMPCELDPGRVRTDYQYGLLVVHIVTEDNP